MKLPRLVIAAVLCSRLNEALPERAAWGVLLVVAGGMITALLSESVIVRLMWWARQASTPLAVPGDPRVRVLVTRRPAEGIGRRDADGLIVPAAWIGRVDLPSLLARARVCQAASAHGYTPNAIAGSGAGVAQSSNCFAAPANILKIAL